MKGAQPGPVLDWMQRVNIAVGSARCLEHLHEKAQPLIIHRDIKSINVVLFDGYVAKIADFNLSNQAPDMAARLHSTRILGTFDRAFGAGFGFYTILIMLHVDGWYIE